PDHDVFIASYIEGLSLEARAHNYVLEVIPLFNKDMDMAQIVKSLNHENFVGFVVLGTELNYADFSVLKSLKLPIVILDSYYEIMDFDFVDMDNFNSVYQIVENLLNRGHKKIGFLRSNTDVQNFRLREKAFQEVLEHFKIPKEDQYIYTVEATFNGAYLDTLKILDKKTELPTAIFAINDIVAYGCIKALKEKEIKIPDDISIIGFDDLPMSAMSDPPLTSMAVNKIRMGQTAIRLLISRIKLKGKKPSEKILIGRSLVTRKSVKPI
ncbi:MAG: substrate-binding domain-containing protein, partial [Sphaerochaetaceae bacterium]